MSVAAIPMTTPLLQDQDTIQGPALAREPGPQRQLMDLDRRIQALELELADPRARNESSKLMLKRTILRLCCFPYHTAVVFAGGAIGNLLYSLYLLTFSRHGFCWCYADRFDRVADRISEGPIGVFYEACLFCAKQVSYPEKPERRVERYLPDVLCGIDTPIDPNNDPLCIPQLCCCCADCCAGFVERRVELMQRGLRSRMRKLTSVARLSQRATQVYEAFESGTRERRFTIHPETNMRESFDVPQSLMGIITEYEYEVPAPTDEQMLAIPLPEDDQPMMQIPIPAGRQMTEEEIVRYRQREWREAEFRKRELERGIRKMKVDCAREGVQLPIGLKV